MGASLKPLTRSSALPSPLVVMEQPMHQTVNKEPVVTLDPTDGTRFPGAVSANPAVWVNGVDIAFGDFTAVQGIDLDVRDGEFLCLLGPSGCGKSTLLSVMAGFKQPAAGKLARHGNPINGAGPEMGYVFQSSDALFDWLSVADNVGFGPRMANLDKHERDRAVKDHLALVGLEHAAALRNAPASPDRPRIGEQS